MANNTPTNTKTPTSNNNQTQSAPANNSSSQLAAPPPKAAEQNAQAIPTIPAQAATTAQQPTVEKSEPSSAKTNRKPFVYYLPMITIVLGAILITQLLLISIFGKNIRQQATDLAISERQQTDHKLAQTAISEHQSDIENLALSFPDLEGIREFAQSLNQQLEPFPEREFDISTNEPVQTQEMFAPLIPVSISVTATPSAFTPIMKKLSESHYLFQPVYLEVNAAQGLSNQGTIDYRGNLFVSKDLINHN